MRMMLTNSMRSSLSMRARRSGSQLLKHTNRMAHVKVQLDFHMSSQFAGVAVALENNLYKNKNLTVEIAPTVPPGEEVWNVLEQQKNYPNSLVVGSAEQNIIVPQIINEKAPVRAVSAMFGRTPLAITFKKDVLGNHSIEELSSNPDKVSFRIGTHEDTVNIMQKIFPNSEVVAVPREEKLKLLMNDEIDAVQIYDVMETFKLNNDLGYELPLVSLEDIPNVKLGYSQVLFAPTQILSDSSSRNNLKSFLDATYEGWYDAIRNPENAAETVLKMQESGEVTGHWDDTFEYTLSTLQLCNEYVKAGRRGEMLGTINEKVWVEANKWLLSKETKASDSLDDQVRNVEFNRMVGHDVARPILDDLQIRAKKIMDVRNGVKPSLLIVTLGNEPLGESHKVGKRRLQIYSPKFHSWFSKVDTGKFLGVDVKQVNLPSTASQSQLEAELRAHHDYDAIQLMNPLPDHIDLQGALAAMKDGQDVDYWNYNANPNDKEMPITPQAVLSMLEFYGVDDVKGKKITIIGRGMLVGKPLMAALIQKNASVNLAHSQTSKDDLQKMCQTSDIVISCVGSPGVVDVSWLKDDAIVVSVGSTFDENTETLCGDFGSVNNEAFAKMKFFANSPGGIGPLCVTELFQRVIKKAEENNTLSSYRDKFHSSTAYAKVSAPDAAAKLLSLPHWALETSSVMSTGAATNTLKSSFHFPTYDQAIDYINRMKKISNELYHHPNFTLEHDCTEGVTIHTKLFTHLLNDVSDRDFTLAEKLSSLYNSFEKVESNGNNRIDIDANKFTYHLPDELIAKYPPTPRGSSRLLVRVPPTEQIKHASLFHHFDKMISSKDAQNAHYEDTKFAKITQMLPNDAHLIFNHSKVFQARLFAKKTHEESLSSGFEVMFLNADNAKSDPGQALLMPANGQEWRCLVRKDDVKVNDILSCLGAFQKSDISLKVSKIHSLWREEGEADGVEATIEFLEATNKTTLSEIFETQGHVPIPPYLNRKSEESDKKSYQTVYAEEEGSVAAPTAGLHFTDEILNEIKVSGVKCDSVCLHVNAGTFKPIDVENVADHSMHEENFSINASVIRSIVRSLKIGRPIIPVGTTSVRVLETLYWLGVAHLTNNKSRDEIFFLDQWEPYAMQNGLTHIPSTIDSLSYLADNFDTVHGSTRIMIVPGYQFRLCDALVTNFHQPHSTLMFLVAALFKNEAECLDLYNHAVQQKYRFLSYGDSSLLVNVNSLNSTNSSPGKTLGTTEMNNNSDMKHIAPETLSAGTRVLLHSCCAPCSGAMIEDMATQGLDVTVLFYNPNIHPKEEYNIRKEENKRYADQLNIPFVDLDYDVQNWYQRAKGMEFSPERGARCTMCFDMRFERTALYAAENDFSVITTTNATSRWKDADQVNSSGIRAAKRYSGVKWWSKDWQTEKMNERKYRINAEQSFYKQEYCGCSYSLRDTNQYRKSKGLEPVVVGGGGVYNDPVADSEEESLDVVANFFSHSQSEEQNDIRELREIYRNRRKTERDSSHENNW